MTELLGSSRQNLEKITEQSALADLALMTALIKAAMENDDEKVAEILRRLEEAARTRSM